MNFEEVAKITPISNLMCHVKVSPSHRCLCVSDTEDNIKKIKFFELTSLRYLTSFKHLAAVDSLFIEENFDGQHNDAIYFGEFGGMTKYRVKDLLILGENAQFLWKIEKKYRFGMAIREIGNKKQLFRFAGVSRTMDIIDAEEGKIIAEMDFEHIHKVFGIEFITPKRLFISCLDGDCCIFDEETENKWKLFKIIQSVDDIRLKDSAGLAIDYLGKKIFLSNTGRIIIFDFDGDVVGSYKADIKVPCGLDFDKRTGLLYVADQLSNSIKIFK